MTRLCFALMAALLALPVFPAFAADYGSLEAQGCLPRIKKGMELIFVLQPDEAREILASFAGDEEHFGPAMRQALDQGDYSAAMDAAYLAALYRVPGLDEMMRELPEPQRRDYAMFYELRTQGATRERQQYFLDRCRYLVEHPTDSPLLTMLPFLDAEPTIQACYDITSRGLDGAASELQTWAVDIYPPRLDLPPAPIEHPVDPQFYGPTCLAGICLPGVQIDGAEILMKYGKGFTVEEEYFITNGYEQDGAYIHISHTIADQKIDMIWITSVPIMAEYAAPLQPFPSLATAEGLALGDPLEKVLELYGQPNYADTHGDATPMRNFYGIPVSWTNIGEQAYSYLSHAQLSFNFAQIYMTQGSVTSIRIHTAI